MADPKRILVVEDDPDQRTLYSQCLEIAGYRVTAVADSEAALLQLHSDDFDLLLSDYVLPDMNGDVLIGSVRQHAGGIRTILMSNRLNVQEVAMACAADDWYLKGDLSQLLILIRDRLALVPARTC